MSKPNVEKISKRLSVSKEMLQKKRSEVPLAERKADPELRRLKKIVRRVANRKRRVAPPLSASPTKES